MAGKDVILCFRAGLLVGFDREDYLYTVFVVIAFADTAICNINMILVSKDV